MATMTAIARPVINSETRTEESAGARTSEPHCHGPTRANSAVNGYKRATAKSAAPALAIQRRSSVMGGERKHHPADRNKSAGRLPAPHPPSTIPQMQQHPWRWEHLLERQHNRSTAPH